MVAAIVPSGFVTACVICTLPVVSAVTLPKASTVAMLSSLLVHSPPVASLSRFTIVPTVVVPPFACGAGLVLIYFDTAAAQPWGLVTV